MRSAVALQHGATEDLLRATLADDDSLLTAEQRAALVLADAFLDDPAGLTAASAEQIRSALTTEQVIELVVRLMQWSGNKAMIALGLDLDEVRPQVY